MNCELKEIHKHLPKNAKYTLHQIQNEIISVLADLLKDSIVKRIQKAKLFTIMADGTTDKNRKEIQGLVCRYVNENEQIEEHCLDLQEVEDRSPMCVFNFIKKTLAKFNFGKRWPRFSVI